MSDQAVEVLAQAQRAYPANSDILYAPFSIYRKQGNQSMADHYEAILRARH